MNVGLVLVLCQSFCVLCYCAFLQNSGLYHCQKGRPVYLFNLLHVNNIYIVILFITLRICLALGHIFIFKVYTMQVVMYLLFFCMSGMSSFVLIYYIYSKEIFCMSSNTGLCLLDLFFSNRLWLVLGELTIVLMDLFIYLLVLPLV